MSSGSERQASISWTRSPHDFGIFGNDGCISSHDYQDPKRGVCRHLQHALGAGLGFDPRSPPISTTPLLTKHTAPLGRPY
jgi:hypothetical protein